MTVYENIKEIASDHGMTVKQVAIKSGIGENSIYRWQKSAPSMVSLKKVAKTLHVSVEELTADDKNTTPQYRAIQRRAKNLSPEDQQKLLDIMKAAFRDFDDDK